MQKRDDFLAFAKNNLSVLYVEDNDDARFLTSMLLEEFFKEVVTAASGKEALELFSPQKFDVVVSDINMPGMSGIELLREIRKQDPEVYIVLISAHSDSEYIIDAIDIGVDGYLIKPLDIQKLQRVVERVAQKEYFRKEAKRYEAFLKAYEDATNRSFLVSRTDAKGIITDANELFCERSKYTKEELIGRPHNIVRHPDNPKELYQKMWQVIKEEKKPFKTLLRNQAKDGSSYWVDAVIYPILGEDGEVEEYLSIRMDISDILSQKLQFETELEYAPESGALLIKVMQFELLQRLYAEEYIEAIEEKSFEVLQNRLRKRFFFERFYNLGEGIFGCVVHERKSKELLKKLLDFIDEINDMVLDVKDIEYDIEIGVSLSFDEEKRLEAARYGLRKIEEGETNLFVSSKRMQRLEKEAQKHFETLQLIKRSIEHQGFVSYFQPIVDNRTKEVVKYESLIRLIDGERVLSPFFFLDVAKKSKYYYDMSFLVLEDAIKKADEYGVAISVNLSILDLRKPRMREKILQILKKYEKSAHLLTFEILEDFDLANIVPIRSFLQEVKAKGVQIAIDDFGSGYANFKRIMEYEPNIVKVDGALIQKVNQDPLSLSVLKGILTFAKEQNIKVVAEFVENEELFAFLRDLGVDYSQGYYFGKPEPLEKYLKG